jgi:hypothetical protein
VANRCVTGTSNCLEEQVASENTDAAAVDSTVSDISSSIACGLDEDSFACEFTTMMSLLNNLNFAGHLLYYYPTSVGFAVVGASLGAALGAVLDSCVDTQVDSEYRRNYYKY